ncbi:bifunctional 2-keto-4-hydroxyglutarate aldolase/2-keto-3-deoxy-6-phosphogluconate aldolase [bacterium BFN5]|nr:bifunctional 2-keto-4-hydroxyglutarate aldolase/2-keto-3-deoxy-6-phosphogluconate aldolase [bacterium BFN5]
MERKQQVLARITESGLVAVVRAESGDQAKKIAEACLAGGMQAIEITYTVPGAHHIMEELAKAYSPDELIIGAGTVLDPETARISLLSGAQYVVSPCLNIETVRLCSRYQVPVMAGAMTIKEIVECLEAGADMIKLFPGELFGPAMVKAIKGPLPQAQIMPTGGVSTDNVREWIKAGCVAVGAGSSLTAGAKNNDYAAITALARRFLTEIAAARVGQ